ncbi:TRAP transporter small permease subunit [Bradyrhizobium sp. LHD-71]|uniref:TRAP transporter small permease n=1 Tax=Bradyrhizobium sp. LHD-71 TaxID=3072141 RepID=UPI00280F970A|nr:TRAP transporter small permease subunit [Bradyrhizobium sp. LHD-71]MDQ8729573.1 TRAP transporter small permease subunit [Bradyrhizobium sp. LHD-71]
MLKRFYTFVCGTEVLVAAVLLIVMVVLIFVGGVARMLGEPLGWTTDFATCAFAWACFLAADVAWRRDTLMSIRLVADRLSPRGQRWLAGLNYLIISLFLLHLIVAGLWLSWISRARSFQGIPDISYSWITLSLPVGAVLLLITTLIKAHAEFSNRRAEPGSEQVIGT